MLNDIEYETIKKDTIVEKYGMVIRLIKIKKSYDYPYSVELAPMYKDDTYDPEEFTTFGGLVGYSTSEFKTLKQAEEFFNDITTLTHEQMAKKYPNLWVE